MGRVEQDPLVIGRRVLLWTVASAAAFVASACWLVS
jgi:hypothetical protein